MSWFDVEASVTPRFPVSLRSPKGRYRAEIKIGRQTYSAVAKTPEKAMKGAATSAELFGGYEIDLPEYKDPGHPLLVDLKSIWAVLKLLGGTAVNRVKNRSVEK